MLKGDTMIINIQRSESKSDQWSERKQHSIWQQTSMYDFSVRGCTAIGNLWLLPIPTYLARLSPVRPRQA